MNKVCLAVLVICYFFLTGCASVPTKDIQIDYHSSPKANISGYTSYAWLGNAAILNDQYGQWEPPQFDADEEIKFLIDRELRARGMVVNSAAPDLVVAFAAGIDMDALALKVDPEEKVEILETVPQGGLVVALLDSESGSVVWVGVATGEVQENIDSETARARLEYAVKNMFKNLSK